MQTFFLDISLKMDKGQIIPETEIKQNHSYVILLFSLTFYLSIYIYMYLLSRKARTYLKQAQFKIGLFI